MIHIKDSIYHEIANKIYINAIKNEKIVNNIKIETNEENIKYIFWCKYFFYKDDKEVVPVWWEMRTYNKEEEIINDFSFYKIKDIIKEF